MYNVRDIHIILPSPDDPLEVPGPSHCASDSASSTPGYFTEEGSTDEQTGFAEDRSTEKHKREDMDVKYELQSLKSKYKKLNHRVKMLEKQLEKKLLRQEEDDAKDHFENLMKTVVYLKEEREVLKSLTLKLFDKDELVSSSISGKRSA
ncbi:uncharacterized protein LOC135464855 [Liolophura sinensis]|uniref:uncharacterized protein LOC135464855 n=1 Tax=Liolophura sinensis TaxID=3198878 RepID=UPI003158CBC2